MEDLITVIIPVYNREKYLHESIESVLNQTYKNLEVILIDDGSIDNSLNICKYYERLDKRVKVLTQKNKGISIAMRNAVKVSKGKYIARCDSDDINELDRYEKQLKYLKENNYDVIGLYVKSFGNGSEVAKKGMEKFMNLPIESYEDQAERIYIGSTIGGGIFFAKADIVKKINPFHKDYGLVEDVYMYIMFHKNNCKLGMLNEVLYNYRVHNSNTSLSGSRKHVIAKYFDVLFSCFYYEKLFNYKYIVIMKREAEEIFIKDVFKNKLNNFKPIFVNEHIFKKFMKDEILKYKSNETIFFVGSKFMKQVIPFLNSQNYQLYTNVFYMVDCYYNE